MKKAKLFLPLFICIASLIAGVILYFVYKDYSVFSSEKFLSLSFCLIGFVGTFSILFIFISDKNIKNKEIQEKMPDILQNKIDELTETIKIQAKKETSKQNKKTVCHYCKHKYDENLDRCPNCGAPPNS